MKEKKKSYSEKLLDQRWQKKRLELLEAAKWKCCSRFCQNQTENPSLHVHHKLYLRGRDPWEYDDWAYMVLCDECHELEQESVEQVHILLAKQKWLNDALYWISRLDESSQALLSESLHSLVSLKPEYVIPAISTLSSLASFQRDLVFAGFDNGLSVTKEIDREMLKCKAEWEAEQVAGK